MISRLRPAEGFALIIAITLMAFILLLLVSLTSLLRVDVMSSQNQSTILQARENARFALYEALGELQRMAGPDTRATARGDIVSNSGDFTFNAHDENRYWTGVWDSTDWIAGNPGNRIAQPGQDGSETSRFLGWLISGSPQDRRVLNSVQAPLDAATPRATLARLREGGSWVEVEAKKLSLGQNGGYAWWVSDEGLKANLTLEDPFQGNRETGLKDDIARFLYPHRFGIEATPRFTGVDPNNEDTQAALGRSLSLASVQQAFPDVVLDESVMADFTVHSLGVLSDQRRGGLKKDLSLAFWRDPAEWRALATGAGYEANTRYDSDFGTHRIFDREDYAGQQINVSSRAFIAPRWDVLRDFHNSYQKLDDPEAPAPAVQVRMGNRLVYDVPRNDDPASWQSQGLRGRMHWDGNYDHVFRDPERDPLHAAGNMASPGQRLVEEGRRIEASNSGLYPLMVRGYYFFSMDMAPSADGGGYAPRIKLTALCNLWNPYNVTLKEDGSLSLSGNDWMMQTTPQVRFVITRIPADDPDTQYEWSFTYQNLRQSDFTESGAEVRSYVQFRLRAGLEPNSGGTEMLTLRPGEIRQYMPWPLGGTNMANVRDSRHASRTAEVTRMKPFFPSDTGYINYDKTGPVQGNATTENAGNYVFQPGDVIGIRIEPIGHLSSLPFRWYAGGIEHNQSAVQQFRKASDSFAGIYFEDQLDVDDLIASSVPLELGGFDIKLKSADTPSGSNPQRILANSNPRAIYIGAHMGDYADSAAANWEVRFITGDPFAMIQRSVYPVGSRQLMRGYWGASDTAAGGRNFVTLFDVPRRPVESMAQYQHAQLSIFPHQLAYALGNSLADPHVDPRYAVDFANGLTQMDLSWLLNDALWDGYFLSTLRPGQTQPDRQRYVSVDEGRVFQTSDYDTAAESLMMRGGFNVNSTSVEAWVALLSSLGGDGIRYFNTEGASPGTTSDLNNPIFRLTVPNANTNTTWLGGPRNLTDAEIRTLAERMVDEVKRRGPFLSLSDFVNRRLESGERGRKGALQAAIDDSGINNGIGVGGGSVSSGSSGAPQGALAAGEQATFAPGWISQADVLTGIGPVLTARSDTFVIRVYGEVTNPITGRTSGEAWGEAVVQRTPELLPTGDDDYGRRFRVVDFRWLNKDEI